MTSASLTAAGLNATDTETASDHAPIVGDFSAPATPPVTAPLGATPPGSGLRLAYPAPNPFGSATSIAWSMVRAGHALLSVHDARGRLVARLADGEFRAGEHTAEWTGRDRHGIEVAAGVYFVRLFAAGEGQRTRRLILSR